MFVLLYILHSSTLPASTDPPETFSHDFCRGSKGVTIVVHPTIQPVGNNLQPSSIERCQTYWCANIQTNFFLYHGLLDESPDLDPPYILVHFSAALVTPVGNHHIACRGTTPFIFSRCGVSLPPVSPRRHDSSLLPRSGGCSSIHQCRVSHRRCGRAV